MPYSAVLLGHITCRCELLLQLSVRSFVYTSVCPSVCPSVCVGHTRWPCKSGWTNREPIWGWILWALLVGVHMGNTWRMPLNKPCLASVQPSVQLLLHLVWCAVTLTTMWCWHDAFVSSGNLRLLGVAGIFVASDLSRFHSADILCQGKCYRAVEHIRLCPQCCPW